MKDVDITPIKISIEFTTEDIVRAMTDPSMDMVERKLEAARRLVMKEHEDRWRMLRD